MATQCCSNTSCGKTFLITAFRADPANLNSQAFKTCVVCHTRTAVLRAKKRNGSCQIGPNPPYLSPKLSIYSNLYVQLLLRPDSIVFGLPIQLTPLLLLLPPPSIQTTPQTRLEPS